MKDLGAADVILRIKIPYTKDGIGLSHVGPRVFSQVLF